MKKNLRFGIKFPILLCLWIVVGQSALGILVHKFVHENGVKEFTVLKEIKRNDCSCSCTCVPKDVAVDGVDLSAPKFSQIAQTPKLNTKYFKIRKVIKNNQCNCICTCTPQNTLQQTNQTLQHIHTSATNVEKNLDDLILTTLSIDQFLTTISPKTVPESTTSTDTTSKQTSTAETQTESAKIHRQTTTEIPEKNSTDKFVESTSGKLFTSLIETLETISRNFSRDAEQRLTSAQNSGITKSSNITEFSTSTLTTIQEVVSSTPVSTIQQTLTTHSDSKSTTNVEILTTEKTTFESPQIFRSTESLKNFTNISASKETLSSLETTPSVNASESTTTPNLSPEFKAKVANLLNRLKEQLFKLRTVQEDFEKNNATKINTNDNNESSVEANRLEFSEEPNPTLVTPNPDLTIKSLSEKQETTTNNNSTDQTNTTQTLAKRAEILLKNLQEKLNQLRLQANQNTKSQHGAAVDAIETELQRMEDSEKKRSQIEFEIAPKNESTPISSTKKSEAKTTVQTIEINSIETTDSATESGKTIAETNPTTQTITTTTDSTTKIKVETTTEATTRVQINSSTDHQQTESKKTNVIGTTEAAFTSTLKAAMKENSTTNTTVAEKEESDDTNFETFTNNSSSTTFAESEEESENDVTLKESSLKTTKTTAGIETSTLTTESFKATTTESGVINFGDSFVPSFGASIPSKTTVESSGFAFVTEAESSSTFETTPATQTISIVRLSTVSTDEAERVKTTVDQSDSIVEFIPRTTTISKEFTKTTLENALVVEEPATHHEKNVLFLPAPPVRFEVTPPVISKETVFVRVTPEIVLPATTKTSYSVVTTPPRELIEEAQQTDGNTELSRIIPQTVVPLPRETFAASEIVETTSNTNTEENIRLVNANLMDRLKQARELREEQRQLERMNSMQRENADLNSENLQRRRLIEQKLAQLAQAERWHRELLHRHEMQQRALANANQQLIETETSTITQTSGTTASSSSIPKHCEPIQKFLDVFNVTNPSEWLGQNCLFVKQYFPTASCSQIQALMDNCVKWIRVASAPEPIN